MAVGRAWDQDRRIAVAAADRLLAAGRLVGAPPGQADGPAAEACPPRGPLDEPPGEARPPRLRSGASLPPYTYAPTRVRHPMARGLLVQAYREARARLGDPVAAWAEISADPAGRRAYQSARGRGGFVRVGWDEALEMAAAAHVHTIGRYGPDRIAGLSPASADSMASYTVGARFMSLIGAPMVSFPERRAAARVVSPGISSDATDGTGGIHGTHLTDATDGPEPGDWRQAAYLVVWGAGAPLTQEPATGPAAQARRREQKAVVVSTAAAEATGSADEWLRPHPGTDGALAMAMGHVILAEYFVGRQAPYFADYARRFTDLPFLVALERRSDGRYAPGRFVSAYDLGLAAGAETEARDGAGRRMPVLVDAGSGEAVVATGPLDRHRHRAGSAAGAGDTGPGGVDPLLSFHHHGGTGVETVLPRFDNLPGADAEPTVTRGVSAREIGGRLVTTVFDLVLAQYAVGRPGLPGTWPSGAARPERSTQAREGEHAYEGVRADEGGRCGGEPRGVVAEQGGEAVEAVDATGMSAAGSVRGYEYGWAEAEADGGADADGGAGAGGGGGGYGDASTPGTPAWQEEITSVPAAAVVRVAREFAAAAERTRGRAVIVTGEDTDRWFHSDTLHRSVLALLVLTGCEGTDGGGWIHRDGRAGARASTGREYLAAAADWARPARRSAGPAYWYLGTDRWRREPSGAAVSPEALSSPTGPGTFTGRHTADLVVQSARLGWTPSCPTFGANPLDLGRQAAACGGDPAAWAGERLADGRLGLACEDPDDPANWPRILTVWRADPIGPAGEGDDCLRHHLLGAGGDASAEDAPHGHRPRDVTWHDEAPRGKLDLLISLDHRMTSTALHSDLVLPAATRHEKHDLRGTDAHPYVHACRPAIEPPWQARSDFEIFHGLAREVARLAKGRLDTVHDLVATALPYETDTETEDEPARPGGPVADPRDGGVPPRPGRTTRRIALVERDYTALADRLASFGPLAEESGTTVGCGTGLPCEESVRPAEHRGTRPADGPASGRPALDTDVALCEAILALSGATGGGLAAEKGRRAPGTADTRPGEPRYALTGRQHFYLDHEWMAELGEQLPVYRPPLLSAAGAKTPGGHGGRGPGHVTETAVTVRYVTPYSTPYAGATQEERARTPVPGGPVIWMSPTDASSIGATDSEWVEAVTAGSAAVARAVVSHRVPRGTVFLHRVRERPVDGPAPASRNGAGGDRTALLVKPTRLIGGAGQLWFPADHRGPTGGPRDAVTTIRRLRREDLPRAAGRGAGDGAEGGR